MSSPLVSVIIPAYNQAEFLPETIQSVLNQTYPHFELIVVNDASTDNTDEVMAGFSDPRIRYIVHEQNQRLSAARNTGINASKGGILFLLDADDLFHPEKLEAHVRFLEEHPEVGVSYNARFELNHSANTIREMWRPPLTVGLKDLLLAFPFAPSDTVVRRDWAFKVGLFDPAVGTAEDTDFPCRLALAGCQFAGIDRALNYRRYHSGRGRKNLPGRIADVERVQAAVFADPRCPQEVRNIGRMAIKHHLMVIVSLALIQNETDHAHKYTRELVALDPSVIKGKPCELVDFLLSECIADESVDHEALLEQIFAGLPRELTWLSEQYDWAVARGWLWKGIRALLWGREDAADSHLTRALALRAQTDEPLMQLITYHLLGYETEFGSEAVQNVLQKLTPWLNRLAKRGGDKLQGSYLINRAFHFYRSQEYRKVPSLVVRACRSDPAYLRNRGVLSILVRSLARTAA
ncbi:MAG: glycosyltransferase family 2 protein [Chloroflexota bacterium]|jgi:glycosyltransferase involved in cell wall biosynthesis